MVLKTHNISGVSKRLLIMYRWLFVWFIVSVIAGSTVFGMYAMNYHASLHLIRANMVNSVVTFALISLIVIVSVLFLSKAAENQMDLKTSGFLSCVDYIYQSKMRLFLILFLAWLPLSIIVFPGSAGWDLAMQAQEIIDNKARLMANHYMSPAEVYPIANYLVRKGEGLLTNQHNFFLTFIYGGTLKYSLKWFNSLVPGLAALSVGQFLLTTWTFAYSLQIMGQLVKNGWVKLISLIVVLLTFMIPVSGWSLSKNPLFATGVILLVISLVGIYQGVVNKREAYFYLAASSVVVLISVKYGWLIIFAEFVLMVFKKALRKISFVTLLLPLIIFKVSMVTLFATGIVIQDDPIESKGIQIQQVALYLQEYPDDLTSFQKSELNEIFDLTAVAKQYNPGNTDAVKASGYYNKNTYKYKSIREDDWSNFNEIWIQMMIKHPSVFIRGAVLKFYGYFDLFAPQLRDITVDYPDFKLKNEDMDEANTNPTIREKLNSFIKTANGAIGVLDSGSVYVILGLILIAAINIKFGWEALIWTVPFYVQVVAMIISPLNASLRYSLGFVYGLGMLMLILFMTKPKRENNNNSFMENL